MSRVQVLVATMNQKDFTKIDEMNIRTDVIYANQSDNTRYDEIDWGKHKAKMITTATRGVGINRNIALTYSDGEILLIADDDLSYVNDYEKIVNHAFKKIPDADAIIFNIETIGMDMQRRKNKKISRVRLFNALNYGAVRIAVRRSSIERENIMFSKNFGGGTLFSAGEDSLFICDILKKHLRMYTYPSTIAYVEQFESTWFQGYTKKFFYDKGALFYALSKKWASLLCVQDLIRHKKLYVSSNLSLKEMYHLERQGMVGYSELRGFDDTDIE